MSVPLCTSPGGPCEQLAVAAVHVFEHRDGSLPTVLIRPDHLEQPDLAIMEWRCADCLHHDIDQALRIGVEA